MPYSPHFGRKSLNEPYAPIATFLCAFISEPVGDSRQKPHRFSFVIGVDPATVRQIVENVAPNPGLHPTPRRFQPSLAFLFRFTV